MKTRESVLNKRTKDVRELCRDLAVVYPGRLADDKSSTHQLRRLAGDCQLLEFVRGHQFPVLLGGHGHVVHDTSGRAPSCTTVSPAKSIRGGSPPTRLVR